MKTEPSPRLGRTIAWLAITVAFATGGLRLAGQMPGPPIVAIENVALVDVVRGTIVKSRTVVIADGIIAALGEPGSIKIPPTAVRVDGRGRYLMPGLVDMHVHLFNNASRRLPNDWTFPLFVANGVTAVREMRTEPAQVSVVNDWRAKVDRGELIAPFVVAAGVAAGAGSVEDARRQVREASAAGADFVKVFSEVREPQWRAMLEEARVVKIPLCGHIPSEVSLLDAATAGQRSNEHLTQVYEACSANEMAWLAARKGLTGEKIVELRDAQEQAVLESFDSVACDRIAPALAKTGQVQVPTLVLPYFEARGSSTNFRDDPRWRSLRSDEQARWERFLKIREHAVGEVKLYAQRWDVSRQIIASLNAAGVRLLAGTDAPMPLVYPGSSLHEELELLVESGVRPADALRAATIWPAEFLGLSDRRGSIAMGKRADLVLLDGDPLADIRHTQRICAVVLAGRLLQRADLDSLLAVTAESPATTR